MRVLTLAMVHNEIDLVPYFVRHYRQLGDVTIFDDASTDGTADAARAEGAVVRPVEDQDDVEYRLQRVKNHAWKPVREQYDWVIAVDVDEFLYHPDLPYVLQDSQNRGVTLLDPCGFEMLSDKPPCGPEPLTSQFRRGVYLPLYSKLCCFNPQRVVDINFYVGAHRADPTGDVVVMAYPDLKLLHYHFLGVDLVMARYANRRKDPPKPEWRAYTETAEQVQRHIAVHSAQTIEVI